MTLLLLAALIYGSNWPNDIVHVRLTVTGPTGPVADVQFVTERECDPIPNGVFATTNSEGVAEFDVARCASPWLHTYAVPRGYVREGTDHHVREDELRRINDLGLYFNLFTKLDQTSTSISLNLPAPGGVTVTLHPEGLFDTTERVFWVSPDGNGAIAEPFRETNSFVLRGVRKGVPGRYYICIEQWSNVNNVRVMLTRNVGFDLGSLDASVDTGTIAIPSAPTEAALDVTQIMHDMIPEDEPGHAGPSVTLVSSDAQTILSYTVPITNLAGPVPYIGHARLPVPVGAFYLVPGGFGNRGACRRLIDRIRIGEDLSSSGIPHFTVGAGETATVNYAWLDAWRAIFQLP